MDVLYEDISYEDYYNAEGLEEFGICKKTHVKEFSSVFLPVLYSVTCVLGVVANSMLLMLFIKYKSLRTVLPVHMVISDVLFTLSLPFWAVYAGSEWVFGEPCCKAVTLVYLVSLYGSNLLVAAQSLQRYMDVLCLNSTIIKSPKRNTVMCVLVWILSFSASAVHISFVETQNTHGHNICTYHFNDKVGWKIYTRFQMTVLGFVIPFVVLLFCSFKISCINPPNFRIARHDTGFTLMFFLLWFPYSAVLFLHALQDVHIIYTCDTNIHFDFAIQVTECIAFMHVFVNPLLYVFVNKKAWKRLRNVSRTQREYLLEESDSSSFRSGQDCALELKSVQAHELSFCAERPNNFLPEPL